MYKIDPERFPNILWTFSLRPESRKTVIIGTCYKTFQRNFYNEIRGSCNLSKADR